MADFLVFQAVQSVDKINQCRYALVKYLEFYNLKPPADITAIVFTDKPALFESFSAHFPGFRLIQRFAPQQKTMLLKELMAEENINILFPDTNTYITGPLEQAFKEISTGTVYLNQIKSSPGDRSKFHMVEWKGKKLSVGDLEYEESVVIGMNSSAKNIMDDCADLARVLTQKRIQHAETAAIHHCLSLSGKVKTANFLQHYPNLKEFSALLRVFFKKNDEESIPNLVKLVHHFNVGAIQKDKSEYDELPLFRKWIRIVRGEKWTIKQYEKKF